MFNVPIQAGAWTFEDWCQNTAGTGNTSTARAFTALSLANNLPAPFPHVNASHDRNIYTDIDEEHRIKKTGVQINNQFHKVQHSKRWYRKSTDETNV
jgi:hypothetical protein